MDDAIKAFVEAEEQRIKQEESPAPPPEPPVQSPVVSEPPRVESPAWLNVPEEVQPKGATRHSLTKCHCEKCQARRRALAVQFGIAAPDEQAGDWDSDLFDEKTIGRIVASFHTYRYVTLAPVSPERAKAWEVSEETEAAFGKLGQGILKKYLGRIDFKYKEELILALYLSSDIGIRFLHERKIALTLEEEENRNE